MSSSSNPALDPFTAKAENTDLSPQEKINGTIELFEVLEGPYPTGRCRTGLHEILKSTRTAMLTTRAPTGHLHSRAMVPCSRTYITFLFAASASLSSMKALESTNLTLVFIANNASQKFAEIENDAQVNVSFCNPSNTSWASYSGKAKISREKELIKKHWSK